MKSNKSITWHEKGPIRMARNEEVGSGSAAKLCGQLVQDSKPFHLVPRFRTFSRFLDNRDIPRP
jgi:hypothetical protein